MCAHKKNTLTHTQTLFASSGHGPLADACRPSFMIHVLAGCCGAVLNHWAEESLRAIKAQRAGHAAGAAAPGQALLFNLAPDEVRKQVQIILVLLEK